MEVVPRILFKKLSNIDIEFITKEHIWRFYIIIKGLFTIKQLEPIDKHKFIQIPMNKNCEIFVI